MILEALLSRKTFPMVSKNSKEDTCFLKILLRREIESVPYIHYLTIEYVRNQEALAAADSAVLLSFSLSDLGASVGGLR